MLKGAGVAAALVSLFGAACAAPKPASLSDPIAKPATSLDAAIQAFQATDYATAADGFCRVVKSAAGVNLPDEAEAQYGVGMSLKKLGYEVGATGAFLKIMDEGLHHPHFDRAIAEVADEGIAVDDTDLVAVMLDKAYTNTNAPALQKLDPRVLQDVHFLLGRYALRRGNLKDARLFLSTIKEQHRMRARAQQLLSGLAAGGDAKSLLPEEPGRSLATWSKLLAAEQGRSAPSSPCLVEELRVTYASFGSALAKRGAPAATPAPASPADAGP
jgi:hypothetical protein